MASAHHSPRLGSIACLTWVAYDPSWWIRPSTWRIGASSVYLAYRRRKRRATEEEALDIGRSCLPFALKVAGAWLVPFVGGWIAAFAALFVMLAYQPSAVVLVLFPLAVVLLQIGYLRLVR